MQIKEMMTKQVLTINAEMSLKDAGKLFRENRISGLPVVDDDANIIGIFTITDMMRILGQIYELKESEKKHPDIRLSEMYDNEKSKAKVGNMMTKDVYVLNENDSIEEVMRLMFYNKVHTIPITNQNGKLVGIIGRRDLVYACF